MYILSDINECQGVVCQHDGTCNDEIGYYTCSCVTGYSGNHCEISTYHALQTCPL